MIMKLRKSLVPLILLLLMQVVSVHAAITIYRSGNLGDVRPELFGPVLDLGGGGTDVDPAIQWMIDKARGCTGCSAKVDVVILRSSGSDGYNAPILAMNGVDSVDTFVITSREDTRNKTLISPIKNAEVIFFAGGDQCDYIRNFRGTSIERAVRSVYARGGAVGGTSAGLAIQGEYVYDGCTGSVTSPQALSNPYQSSISFTYDFFKWRDLEFAVTDTHFFQRDRMGRLFAFLARQLSDRQINSALGIAVSESTSVVVDTSGLATVMGNGNGQAYFVRADHPAEICSPGVPLTYSNFKIWKVSQGATFDLRNRPTTGFYTVSVNNGTIQGSPY